MQWKLKQIVKANIEEIDDTLWIILDPGKRTIDKEELKKDYNYLDEDLDKLDLEWRIENY